MKPTLSLLVATLLGSALLANPARAEIIWPDAETLFKMEWTHNIPGNVMLADNHGQVNFSKPAGFYDDSSSFVASNLQTVSKGTRSNPSLLINNGYYDLTVTIHDRMSGESQSYTFANNKLGVVVNPLTNFGAKFGANFTQLVNQFGNTDPVVLYFAGSGNTYILTLNSAVLPDTSNSSGQASIGGYVQLIPGTDGGIQKVPEPSSLLLGAFGLTVAGGTWWRKRRKS